MAVSRGCIYWAATLARMPPPPARTARIQFVVHEHTYSYCETSMEKELIDRSEAIQQRTIQLRDSL